ncbi:zinc-binding dehydrogenase [Amycolatopsis sp. lyj-109]|uniref:zinc-binding dehydrogenase n=1 Tax=Amycolatopsis sp. lyj-109 TaxID=2789287 RepID=UPI00397D8FC1
MHGTVCFTGMLSNQWTISNFYPIGYLPAGVRLTAYGGEADDLPAPVLQRHLDRIAAGETSLGPVEVYSMAEIRQAHDDLEHNRTAGKLVVLTGRSEGAAP